MVADFARLRLTQAFDSLRNVDDPVNLLLGAYFDYESHENYIPVPDHCTYHLFTNAIVDLEEASVTGITDLARRLFEERFGHPAGKRISFGLGTPETILNGAPPEIVRRFIVDLLNMPSSYYFLARRGEITVTPATEHSAFYSHAPYVGSQRATTTSSIPKGTLTWPDGLSDLQTLINGSRTKEDDLQRFFEEYPQFLFALDERYCEVRSHVGLVDTNGTHLIPDFLVRLEDTGGWDAIELKRPQHNIISGRDRRAAKSAGAAIAQLLTYRDFFASHENRRKFAERHGTAPYEPCLLVVIGRGIPSTSFRWDSLRVGVPSVKLVTYDFLFERARDAADSLRQSVRA